MSDGCGPPPWTRCAEFGPGGSCGRTRVLSLDLGMESPSDGFSAKWPKQGMWDSGGAYALPMSEPLTVAPECSSLLPTPAAADSVRGPDYARAGREESGGDDLVTTMACPLPAPTSRDHKGRNQRDDDSCLPGAVGKLLPTPTAADAVGARNRTANRQPGAAAHIGDTLTDAMWKVNGVPEWAKVNEETRLLPTPTARLGDPSGRRADAARYKGPKSQGSRRSNLDDMVEAVRTEAPWLGETTPPPSSDGNGCSDPTLPLWTTEDD